MFPLIAAHPIPFAYFLIVSQITGLVSACAVRRSEGSRHQASFQWAFLGALSLVGFSTVLAVGVGPERWLAPAATLGLMIVLSMWDFHRRSALRSR